MSPATLGVVLGLVRYGGQGWDLGRGAVAYVGRRPGGDWCDTAEVADALGVSTARMRATLRRLEDAKILWRDDGGEAGRRCWVEVNPQPARWKGIEWRLGATDRGIRFELGRRIEHFAVEVTERELRIAAGRFSARPKHARCTGASARHFGYLLEMAEAAGTASERATQGSRAEGSEEADGAAVTAPPLGRALTAGTPLESGGPGGGSRAGAPEEGVDLGSSPSAQDPALVPLSPPGRGGGATAISYAVRTAWRATAGLPLDVTGKLEARVAQIVEHFGEAQLLELLATTPMPSNVRGKARVWQACSWAEDQLGRVVIELEPDRAAVEHATAVEAAREQVAKWEATIARYDAGELAPDDGFGREYFTELLEADRVRLAGLLGEQEPPSGTIGP